MRSGVFPFLQKLSAGYVRLRSGLRAIEDKTSAVLETKFFEIKGIGFTGAALFMLAAYGCSIFAIFTLPHAQNANQITFVWWATIFSFFATHIILLRTTKLKIHHWIIALSSALIFFIFVIISKKWLYHFVAGAYDWAIFAQAIHLISEGKAPYSTLMGIHYMGDQMHYIFYPLGLLAYFLGSAMDTAIIAQSLAIAASAFPLYAICRHFELASKDATLITVAFLFSPILWHAPYSDFHPDVFYVPGALTAYLGALRRQWILLAAGLFLCLSAKFLLSLSVIAFGLSLGLTLRARWIGAAIALLGAAHFLVAAGLIMPAITGSEQTNLGRYGYLGDSLGAVIGTVLLQPWIPAGRLLSADSLLYFAKMLAPVFLIVWMRPRSILPLLGAGAALALNALSDSPGQRIFDYHYQLPVVAFIYVAIAYALKGEAEQTLPVKIIRAGLLPLALALFFLQGNLVSRTAALVFKEDERQATRKIVALTPPASTVLADHKVAPQLSERPGLYLTGWTVSPYYDLGLIDHIAIDERLTLDTAGEDHVVTAEVRRVLAEISQDGPAWRMDDSAAPGSKAFWNAVGCKSDEEGIKRASGAGLRIAVYERRPWQLKKDFSELLEVDYVHEIDFAASGDGPDWRERPVAIMASGRIPQCVQSALTLEIVYNGRLRVLSGPDILYEAWSKDEAARISTPLPSDWRERRLNIEYRNAPGAFELKAELAAPDGARVNLGQGLAPHLFEPLVVENGAYLFQRIGYLNDPPVGYRQPRQPRE